jgi:hypothetical protein
VGVLAAGQGSTRYFSCCRRGRGNTGAVFILVRSRNYSPPPTAKFRAPCIFPGVTGCRKYRRAAGWLGQPVAATSCKKSRRRGFSRGYWVQEISTGRWMTGTTSCRYLLQKITAPWIFPGLLGAGNIGDNQLPPPPAKNSRRRGFSRGYWVQEISTGR